MFKRLVCFVAFNLVLCMIGLAQQKVTTTEARAGGTERLTSTTAEGLSTDTPIPGRVATAPSLKLSADDQKQLDAINEQISQMKPQLEKAQKQQSDAQAKLQEANAFISQYNQVDALRMAFLFRVAADVCGCKTSELEFSADGKSVVKKSEVRGSKSDVGKTNGNVPPGSK